LFFNSMMVGYAKSKLASKNMVRLTHAAGAVNKVSNFLRRLAKRAAINL
jgi:hypothetical protein